MSTDTNTESVEALAATLTSVYGIDRIKPCEQSASMLRTLAAERDGLQARLDSLADWVNAREAEAVATERERCAKLCEGMHPEDGPYAYAWVIRSTPKDPT